MPLPTSFDTMQSMPKHKSTLIGYARVSTDEQNLDLQLDALNNARCSIMPTTGGTKSAERPYDLNFSTCY